MSNRRVQSAARDDKARFALLLLQRLLRELLAVHQQREQEVLEGLGGFLRHRVLRAVPEAHELLIELHRHQQNALSDL